MPAPDKTVLILGGTAEAATLAARLDDLRYDVITSLAGRTREPAPLKGKTRTGGYGGAQGLADYIAQNNIALLVDLTHPFATKISENAGRAAEISGVKFITWQRPAWSKLEGDNWHEVETLAAAITAIPPKSRVLLALGSQHVAPFATRADVHFLVRMIDRPKAPLALPDHELLLAKPGSVEEEYALLADRKITHIVCRNSGGKGAYAKIAAARLLIIPVIILKRHANETSTTSLDLLEQQIISALA